MEIVFFNRNPKAGFSIHRGFEPMISSLKRTDDVKECFVPCHRAYPWSMIKNVLYVYRHRTKNGINHITGDIHYCVLGLLGVPSVLTIHDDYSVETSKYGILDKWYKIFIWLWLPIRIAKQVVFITPAAKEVVEKYVEIKESNIITHQAVENDFKYSLKEFNKECPRIFHMGTMPHKNLETTLKALEGLSCKLVVIQKMTTSQSNLANRLSIDYDNLFDLTNEEIINEYRKSDIIVFPTLREGLGAPIIEGQSIGRPVITTDKAPMNWVAGDCALLLKNPLDHLELRSNILRLINDSELRSDLVRKGLYNIKRFSLKDIVQKYKDLYSSVL